MCDLRVTSSMWVWCVLVVAGTLRATPAAATGLGKCPLYPPLPNFNIHRMAGKWYEVERSFYLMEITASCTEIDVTFSEKGNLLITVDSVNRWTGKSFTTYGIGVPSYNGSSMFRYKQNNRMPYIIGRMLPGAGLYNILFTDYHRFAIVWSCSNLSIAHADRMWILGRQREIAAELRAQIYSIMEELRLDPDRLIISKNFNCTEPYIF